MTLPSASDTSALVRPIGLGSATIIQLLDARSTATKEVLGYLERECDAILECRQCRSLFRSLANFISHKRIHCLGVLTDPKALQKFYAKQPISLVEPKDSDGGKGSSRSSKPSNNVRRGINAKRKARPVRKTVPADLVNIQEKSSSNVILKPIEGVSCALAQVVEGSDLDGRSSVTGSSSDKSETITTVEPKDGYPNMNLRQRSTKVSLAAEINSHFPELGMDINTKAANRSKNISSKALAEALSKRKDCDFTKMKCLSCNATFATAKTLNFHMINKHSKQRKLYPCIYCKNVFTQFWGVTRHLKSAHNLSGDTVDKVREKIRARVFTEPLPAEEMNTMSNNETSPDNKKADNSTVPAGKASLCCNLCSKVFAKRQYLHLHMVACYKKSGLEPPPFKKQSTEEKAPKPLLFVCKTCNRAFSMRQSMVMHAVTCSKRRKDNTENEKTKADAKDSNTSNNSNSASTTKIEATEEVKVEPATEVKDAEASNGSPRESKDSGSSTPEQQGSKKASSPEAPDLKKTSAKFETDDILCQLSPSDEAKEEERNQTPPATPTSLALGRPKRNLKPKQFSDGTVNVRRKVPEVVRVQQADGSQVYKLRQDVEAAAVAPSTQMTQLEESAAKEEDTGDIVKAKDNKGMRILIQGESVPLLDEDDEAKIAGMIDIRKLVCLKCKRQYGSSSNLRRHAVRHLGWRRYKCKLCKFTSYNKSECKSHLRKCHHSEVATLLDGGLAPYIIDLGALLDEGCEENTGKLNLSLPTTSENGRRTPTNRRTRAQSKEPSTEANEAAPVEEHSGSLARRKSGRTRKQPIEAPSDGKTTPTTIENNSKSVTSSGGSEKIGDSTNTRARGRSRKQELRVLSDSEVVAQDENNKRPRSAISGASAENEETEAPRPKVVKVVDVKERKIEPTRSKEQSVNLEGLVNKLRSIRKPLTGTEDNSKVIKIETLDRPVVNDESKAAAAALNLSPTLHIPTTVSEAAASGDN